MKEVCIIGGGASALMCACFVKNNVNITIYEKTSKLGKKIIVSGNGRCNLTNRNMNKHSYSCNINNYMQRFTNEQTIDFFNSIGLETYADNEGRVYPITNSSQSVFDVLNNYIKQKNNIKFVPNAEIVDVFNEKSQYFIKLSDSSIKKYDAVVFASGNQTNLKLLDKFNVEYNNFLPSLCALHTDTSKNLSGIRVFNVGVSCSINNDKFYEEGEVLFKEDAISGIVIFNLSAFMSRKKSFANDIYVDFLPKMNKQELINELSKRVVNLSKLKVKDFFTGLFVGAISEQILSKAHLNYNLSVSTINNKQIECIVDIIKNYHIKTFSPCDNNQVCSGGVKLSCLDDNLQSTNNNGLYFMGEVVDVDGVCGGYNLQWAWTSGKIVGESLWN